MKKIEQFKFMKISQENIDLYKIKIDNSLITDEFFNILIEKTIDNYLYYIKGEYNDLFNRMVAYSINNGKPFEILDISKENLSKIKLDKDFYNLLINNLELYSSYFGGKNNFIFNKMLEYNIDNHKIYEIENLDDLIQDKKIKFNNIREVISKINEIIDRYTIYVREDAISNEEIILYYFDLNENSIEIEKNYKYLLEISIIKDELLPLYMENLNELNIYSIENLVKMIVYYAENDTHMEIERILYPEINIPIVKGGFAIWGKKID